MTSSSTPTIQRNPNSMVINEQPDSIAVANATAPVNVHNLKQIGSGYHKRGQSHRHRNATSKPKKQKQGLTKKIKDVFFRRRMM